MKNNYDIIIIGAGPGGIFSAYEIKELCPELSVAVFEAGHELKARHCPIDGDKIKSCISCKSCSIMSGFGGAGAFSDGKYNITNDFGGTLYEYIGKVKALELMRYVDENDWVTYVLLVLLPPLGIYLLWRRRRFELPIRWGVSAASAIWFVILLILLVLNQVIQIKVIF